MFSLLAQQVDICSGSAICYEMLAMLDFKCTVGMEYTVQQLNHTNRSSGPKGTYQNSYPPLAIPSLVILESLPHTSTNESQLSSTENTSSLKRTNINWK